MKTGLFFGSFNPMHIGHLILSNYIIETTDLDQIWFVVSPQNPLKKKHTLLEDHHRLEMVNLAIKNYPKFKSSDVEYFLPQPSYTIDTLVVLKEKHPEQDFVLIMGRDNLASFHKWKNYEQILKHHQVLVYPRIIENGVSPQIAHENIKEVKAPIIELSATTVRNMIKENKNVRPMLPPEVFEYIDGSNLYK